MKKILSYIISTILLFSLTGYSTTVLASTNLENKTTTNNSYELYLNSSNTSYSYNGPVIDLLDGTFPSKINEFYLSDPYHTNPSNNFTLQSLTYECSDDLLAKTYLVANNKILQSKNVTTQDNRFTYVFDKLDFNFTLDKKIVFGLDTTSKTKPFYSTNICYISNMKIHDDDKNTDLQLNKEIKDNTNDWYNQIKLRTYEARPTLAHFNSKQSDSNGITVPSKLINSNTKNSLLADIELALNKDTTLNEVYLRCRGDIEKLSNYSLEIQNQTYLPSHTKNFSKENIHDAKLISTQKSNQVYFPNLNISSNDPDTTHLYLKADTLDPTSSDLYCQIIKAKINNAEDISSAQYNIVISEQSDIAGIDDVRLSNEYHDTIKFLVENGIVNGYENGTFLPSKEINRAEVAKILAESFLEDSFINSKSHKNCFNDLTTNAWYENYVCSLKDKGWIQGDNFKNQYRPNDTVNSVEALKMILETLETDLSTSPHFKSLFNHVDDSEWYAKYLNKAQELNIIHPYKYLKLNKNLSRGEFAQMLYNALHTQEKLDLQTQFIQLIEELAQKITIVSYKVEKQYYDIDLRYECSEETFQKLQKLKDIRKDNYFALQFQNKEEDSIYRTAGNIYNNYPTSILYDLINSSCYDLSNKYLEEHPEELNEQAVARGKAPIHIATDNKDFKMIKMLVEKGADVNLQTSYDVFQERNDFTEKNTKNIDPLLSKQNFYHGYTPLHYAVNDETILKGNEIEIIQYLLDHGANLNITKSYYPETSILEQAATTEIHDFLIEKGALTIKELKIKHRKELQLIENLNSQKLLPPSDDKIYFSTFPDFGGPEDQVSTEKIQDFEKLAQHKITWATFSNNWYNGLKYPKAEIHEIYQNGTIPFVRLMPRSNDTQYQEEEHFSLENIIRGEFDEELIQWALEAKEDNIPLLIDFAVEPNGDWFPWSGVLNGGSQTDKYGFPDAPNGPERYKHAYRHIIDVFKQVGTSNITWFFHPDIYSLPDEEWNAPKNYYPGDDYIDWIGISLYGPQNTGEDYWDSFSQILNERASTILEISDTKPFALLEFGVTDHHPLGSKSEWLEDAFQTILNESPIKFKAINYWHENWEEEDESQASIRIDSSNESLKTFQNLVQNEKFISNGIFSQSE